MNLTHARAALYGFVLLLIVACIWGAHMSGQHEQAANDAEQAATIELRTRAEATAQAQAALVPVKRANDSLHAANASLATRNANLTRLAAERETSANLVRSRLVVKHDTATLSVGADSVVRIAIPHDLALQLVAERMVTDSAFAAMEHKQQSDALLIAGLSTENDGLRTQIGLDSVVVLRYRAEVAAADSVIAAANRAARPSLLSRVGSVLKAASGGFIVGVLAMVIK